jgi:ribose transport system substrate-binding protein
MKQIRRSEFMKGKRIVFLVVLVCFMLFSGFSIMAEGSKEAAEKEDQFVLAFTSPNLNPGYQAVLWGVRSEIKDDPRIKLEIGAPELETDITKQLNMIEDFIEKKVDAIALCTMADAVAGNYITKANEAGIPVFAYNTPALWPTGNVLTSIGFDQREAGRIMARYAVEHYLQDGGKVGIVEGMPGIFTDFRAGGVAEVLDQYPNIEIVSRQSADWDRFKATTVAENMMTAHPDLKVIFAICDEMGIGAAAAVAAANKHDQIKIVSHDATYSGLQAIESGLLDATVNINNIEWGVEIGKAFKSYVIDGTPIPKVINVDMPMVDSSNYQSWLDRSKSFEEKYSK